MKNVALILVLVLAIIGTCVLVGEREVDTRDYIRIHIRANSNSKVDQDLKYCIKSEIVSLMTPRLEGVKSADEARHIVEESLRDIDEVADRVLDDAAIGYSAHSEMRREHFPVRHYGNMTLGEGDYDALIVELGAAEGDNWWCVVFPPLCFVEAERVGDGTFHYVSKIEELIRRHSRGDKT